MKLIKRISEPVYAMVLALEERPKSFGVFCTNKQVDSYTDKRCITILDRKTKQKFKFITFFRHPDIFTHIMDVGFDLTGKEKRFLLKHANKWLNKKYNRVDLKKRQKVKRKYGCL